MKNLVNFQSCIAANSSQQCSCLSCGSMCSRFCPCYNCCNPLNTNSKVTPLSLHERCRCGRGREKGESNRPSCCDCPGERKAKCLCLKSGISCGIDYQCLDCRNPHNETSKRSVVSAGPTNIPKKRKRSDPYPYNRKGGTKYLISQGSDVTAGRWNDLETLLLLVVYEVLEISDLHGVSQNIVTLYNFVAGSSQVAQMELDITAKRSAQITGKLFYFKGRHNLLDDLMNNK